MGSADNYVQFSKCTELKYSRKRPASFSKLGLVMNNGAWIHWQQESRGRICLAHNCTFFTLPGTYEVLGAKP